MLKVCYYDKVSNIFKRKGYFGKEIPKSRNPFLVTCIIRFENIFLQVLDDDPLPVPVMKEKPSKFLLLAHRMIKKPIILNVGGYRWSHCILNSRHYSALEDMRLNGILWTTTPLVDWQESGMSPEIIAHFENNFVPNKKPRLFSLIKWFLRVQLTIDKDNACLTKVCSSSVTLTL